MIKNTLFIFIASLIMAQSSFGQSGQVVLLPYFDFDVIDAQLLCKIDSELYNVKTEQECLSRVAFGFNLCYQGHEEDITLLINRDFFWWPTIVRLSDAFIERKQYVSFIINTESASRRIFILPCFNK